MKGLFLKDCYITKKFVWLLLISMLMPALILPLSIGTNEVYVVGTSLSRLGIFGSYFAGAAILIRALRADEDSGWLQTSFSSPLWRREYLTEKYLFGLFVISVPVLICVLLTAASYAVAGDIVRSDYLEVVKLGAGIVCDSVLTCLWIVPVCVRFGVQKFWGLFLGYIMLSLLFTMVSLILHPDASVEKVLTYGINGITVIIAIILFIMSWKWINNKEV